MPGAPEASETLKALAERVADGACVSGQGSRVELYRSTGMHA